MSLRVGCVSKFVGIAALSRFDSKHDFSRIDSIEIQICLLYLCEYSVYLYQIMRTSVSLASFEDDLIESQQSDSAVMSCFRKIQNLHE